MREYLWIEADAALSGLRGTRVLLMEPSCADSRHDCSPTTGPSLPFSNNVPRCRFRVGDLRISNSFVSVWFLPHFWPATPFALNGFLLAGVCELSVVMNALTVSKEGLHACSFLRCFLEWSVLDLS